MLKEACQGLKLAVAGFDGQIGFPELPKGVIELFLGPVLCLLGQFLLEPSEFLTCASGILPLVHSSSDQAQARQVA